MTVETINSSAASIRPFPCLERIIDKKVNEIALTCFESLIDWFCSHFYCSYNAYYQYRLGQREVSIETSSVEVSTTTTEVLREQIHHLWDGTPLYDRTKDQIAGLKAETYYPEPENRAEIRNPETIDGRDRQKQYLIFNGKKIFFHPYLGINKFFGSWGHLTKEVSIENDPVRENIVYIIEKELLWAEPQKWEVDLEAIYESRELSPHGVFDEQVYLARRIDC